MIKTTKPSFVSGLKCMTNPKKVGTRPEIAHFGIGINDADYVVYPADTFEQGIRYRATLPCPYYVRWRAMLTACYAPSTRHRGITLCDEWRSFMSFRAWMMKQKWEGTRLVRNKGCKIYSPTTCYFQTTHRK